MNHAKESFRETALDKGILRRKWSFRMYSIASAKVACFFCFPNHLRDYASRWNRYQVFTFDELFSFLKVSSGMVFLVLAFQPGKKIYVCFFPIEFPFLLCTLTFSYESRIDHDWYHKNKIGTSDISSGNYGKILPILTFLRVLFWCLNSSRKSLNFWLVQIFAPFISKASSILLVLLSMIQDTSLPLLEDVPYVLKKEVFSKRKV